MDYLTLVTEIQSYTENEYVPADFNTFIQQAEQRIYNAVQLPALRKNSIGALTANNKYLLTPTDWLATYSLAVVDPATGDYSYLLDKDVNFIRAAYPNPLSTGSPEYYAVFDKNTFILGPTPDQVYQAELHYYYYPESIVTAGNTWLGDNFSSVLFYGTLVEAGTFMKAEPDMLAVYIKRYDEAMALMKQLGDGKNRRDAYRSGQVRYPVT
tara:strand:- start:303 stop:935 length:633 start_codon:yes stop_codon:yes gene_type:complete